MPSKYESTSYSSSSKGGLTAADALFEKGDTNRDGVIDRAEFSNLLAGDDSGCRSSTYETSRYSSGVGVTDVELVGRRSRSSYETTGGYDITEINQAANYTADTNAAWCRYGAEVRGAGLYIDPNPEYIRRELSGGVQTYTQNIRLRFLQPPPVPASGVS
jgi:hypothetical protein